MEAGLQAGGAERLSSTPTLAANAAPPATNDSVSFSAAVTPRPNVIASRATG